MATCSAALAQIRAQWKGKKMWLTEDYVEVKKEREERVRERGRCSDIRTVH